MSHEPRNLAAPKHLGDVSEAGCPLPATHSRLDEMHYFWHQTAEAYSTPEEFRYNLNALIQAARNVTFMLQSEKDRIPDFEVWYERWREKLKADPIMKWLHDARTTVVKQADLKTSSQARVDLIASYTDSPQMEATVSPLLTTEEMLATAPVRQILEEARSNPVLEVERTWVADGLEGLELLEAFAHAYGVLFKIVAEAHEKCGATMKVEVNRPPDLRLPCMVHTDDYRCIRVDLQSGEPRIFIQPEVANDTASKEEAAQRYRFDKLGLERVPSGDPFELTPQYLRMARAILAKDGNHAPMVLLRNPEGRWVVQMLLPEDRQDKFLHWRRLARDVEVYRYDAYIFISEAWMYQLEAPGQTVESERREALVATAEAADGRVRHWVLFFHRKNGKICFDEEHVDEGVPGFSAPVREVWSRIFRKEH